MRSIAATYLLFLFMACTGTKKISTEFAKLNGTWIPQSQTMGGRALPSSVFAKQQLIIADSNYTVVAESVDKGVLKVKNGWMDIYGKEGVNKGKHFSALYKLEKDQLMICYNLKGDNYPESFETAGNPLYFLSIFKKQ